MVDFVQIVLVAVGGVIVLVSALMWLLALDRLSHGQPLLELVPRREVPWSLVDLLLVGMVGFLVLLTSQWICLRQFNLPEGGWELTDLTARQQIGVLLTFSASSLVTGLAAMGVCRWRSRATRRDLGWDGRTWRRDFGLGVGGYVMLIVPVLAIHFLAQWVFPSEETHPFIDLIMDDPQIAYLAPIAFAALVAAPMVEEFFFRVLLQGWLERLTARMEHPVTAVEASEGGPAPKVDGAIEVDGALETKEVTEVDRATEAASHSIVERLSPEAASHDDHSENPYRSPLAPLATGPSGVVDAVGRQDGVSLPATTGLPEQRRLRRIVIGISSLAFAMAHFGQGPAPVSLFVLALGLGYLYQRTHRVLPCIIVHFLVNLTAVIQLALAIVEGQG